ncbi:hypothetical protein B0J14DRAFT_684647 [Halenospora varia]|nr:hypothetical protein B0J14DRAFT_684647 [Halenospora varia]
MYGLVKYILGDIAAEILEITVGHETAEQETYAIAPDDKSDMRKFDHCLWRIELRYSEEIHAFDITGAQYGYFTPITTFSKYCQQRVARFIALQVEYNYFGGCKDRVLTSQDKNMTPNFQSIMKLNQQFAELLMKGVRAWEIIERTLLQLLLNASEKDFERRLKELVAYVTRALRSALIRQEPNTRSPKLNEKVWIGLKI